eukprot:COSAG04_NODE_25000_length_313_cov_0.981308_1_plen_76_part_10
MPEKPQRQITGEANTSISVPAQHAVISQRRLSLELVWMPEARPLVAAVWLRLTEHDDRHDPRQRRLLRRRVRVVEV